MAISTPMLVTFIVYIFGMVLIGFIAWRSTKNFDDYILGGRSLGPFVTALSAGASDMSGWLLMGLPGAIFISGISESWIAIGLTLGAWINWKLVAGRLRVHTEVNNNALTLPDYFTGRFEDKSRVLDRYRPGQPDDICPDPDAGHGDYFGRRLWRIAGSYQAKEH